VELRGEILLPGAAEGPLLKLRAPISFWGGVDSASGKIVDVRHPDHGRCVAGTMLALPGTIGSSSSSSVLLELTRRGMAPAGMLLAEVDAILLVGLVVAHEMGWPFCPALRLDAKTFAALDQVACRIRVDGTIEALSLGSFSAMP
jgi:predicted aconitase with swiveling domain